MMQLYPDKKRRSLAQRATRKLELSVAPGKGGDFGVVACEYDTCRLQMNCHHARKAQSFSLGDSFQQETHAQL